MYLNCPQTTLLSRCQCFFLPSHTFDLSTATFYTQSMLCPCPCHVTFPNHYIFNFSTAILLLGLACFVLIDHVRGCPVDPEEGGDAVEEEENSEGDDDNEDECRLTYSYGKVI